VHSERELLRLSSVYQIEGRGIMSVGEKMIFGNIWMGKPREFKSVTIFLEMEKELTKIMIKKVTHCFN